MDYHAHLKGSLTIETVARFGYIFARSMTCTDDAGKRMSLWFKEEVGGTRVP